MCVASTGEYHVCMKRAVAGQCIYVDNRPQLRVLVFDKNLPEKGARSHVGGPLSSFELSKHIPCHQRHGMSGHPLQSSKIHLPAVDEINR